MCGHAGSQANHLPQAINYAEMAILMVGNYQMKAIGTEIDCSKQLGPGGFAAHSRLSLRDSPWSLAASRPCCSNRSWKSSRS